MIITIATIGLTAAGVSAYYKYRDYQKHNEHITSANNAIKKYYQYLASGATAGANKIVKYGVNMSGITSDPKQIDQTVWKHYFYKLYFDYKLPAALYSIKYIMDEKNITKALNSISSNIRNKKTPESKELMQYAFVLVTLFSSTSAINNEIYEGLKYYGKNFYNSYLSSYENDTSKQLMNYLNKVNWAIVAKFGLNIIETNVQGAVTILLDYFLKDIIEIVNEQLNQIFPPAEKLVVLLNFVSNFQKFKVMIMEMISEGKEPHEVLLQEMTNCFWLWLKQQAIQSKY